MRLNFKTSYVGLTVASRGMLITRVTHQAASGKERRNNRQTATWDKKKNAMMGLRSHVVCVVVVIVVMQELYQVLADLLPLSCSACTAS